MATHELLLDPTGTDDGAQDSTLSPRPVSLRGLTIGLLDNTKPNSTMLLEEIASQLRQHHGAGEARLYTKEYFGTPVSDSLLEQIADECDVVITAVGDCGSCSAATVADGIMFERAGIPTVSITSDLPDVGTGDGAGAGVPGLRLLRGAASYGEPEHQRRCANVR